MKAYPKMAATEKTPIDMEYLTILTDGDPGEEKELFKMFRDQMNKNIRELEKSFIQENNSDWEKIAHRMKGSSASVGAKALSDACMQAEHSANCSSREKEQYLLGVMSKLNDVMQFIEWKMEE
jgi:HPt (histidine-containing phosphotransfer) domain-containing protein